MAHLDATVGLDASQALPVVRKIGIADLKDALVKGIDDFRAMPTHAIFLSLIYPVGAIIVAQLTLNDLFHLFFPLAAGFALIGPVAALGLYELSRQRELGRGSSWTHAFGVLHSRSIVGIVTLGVLLVVIFFLWVAFCQALYVATFGVAPPASIPNFLHQVFTTRAGWTLIAVGNGVGFLFALFVLMISVVSFPLLLDRNVGVGRRNPHLDKGDPHESRDDGVVGIDDRGASGDRLAAAVHRARGRDAGARTFDLAPLSQSGRA